MPWRAYTKPTCPAPRPKLGRGAPLVPDSAAGVAYRNPGGSPIVARFGAPTGWRVDVLNGSGAAVTVRVVALCASP